MPAGINDRNIDIDTRGVSVQNDLITAADARAGIIRLVVAQGESFDEGDEIEFSYRGSDSFEITLDYRSDDDVDMDFVVPAATDMDDDGFGDYFAVVSQNGKKVRIGVSFGGGDDDEDYSQAVPGHLTVLGVTYGGVERITVPRQILADGTGSTGDFTVTLDDRPLNVTGANMDDDGNPVIDEQDIYVAGSSNASVNDGNIMFAVDGSSLTVNPGVQLEAGDTIDIAYAVAVGMNPRNALDPNVTDVDMRPVIRVGKGSRVTITSDNDDITVDAEDDAPTFDNASPASGSSIMDLEQVLSIDITDAVAGVDTDSIEFRVSSSPELAGAAVLGNDDITLATDGDVVMASVALDDLREKTNLPVNEDGEDTIYWWVEASDKAGNAGTSDAKPDDEEDPGSQGSQGYMLRIDNAAPTMTGAFTGEQWGPQQQRRRRRRRR